MKLTTFICVSLVVLLVLTTSSNIGANNFTVSADITYESYGALEVGKNSWDIDGQSNSASASVSNGGADQVYAYIEMQILKEGPIVLDWDGRTDGPKDGTSASVGPATLVVFENVSDGGHDYQYKIEWTAFAKCWDSLGYPIESASDGDNSGWFYLDELE